MLYEKIHDINDGEVVNLTEEEFKILSTEYLFELKISVILSDEDGSKLINVMGTIDGVI